MNARFAPFALMLYGVLLCVVGSLVFAGSTADPSWGLPAVALTGAGGLILTMGVIAQAVRLGIAAAAADKDRVMENPLP